jgi:uncharacterized membrane-anchored protein YhcB (DUF1043 family)
MLGWFAIPGTWLLVLLALAPIVGVAVGVWAARSRHRALKGTEAINLVEIQEKPRSGASRRSERWRLEV